MLNYCILVTSSAHGGGQLSYIAFQFAQTLLECGHRIIMVFFYHDGIYNANKLNIFVAGELNTMDLWQKFSHEHKVKLSICVSAAMRRGVINTEQSAEFGLSDSSVQENFQLDGLGSLTKAILDSDRLIKF